jgi:hypothetical protein
MTGWAALLLAGFQAQDLAEEFDRPPSPGQLYGGWERVRSADHPDYNRIEWNEAGFIRLSTLGRMTSLQMAAAAAWEIEPAAPYRLSARVRLLGTERNGISVSLLWRDAELRMLDRTDSPVVRQAGGWTELAVEVRRIPERARRLAVRFDFGDSDVRGSCDIDHVRLLRRPSLELLPVGRPRPLFDSLPAALEVRAIGLPAAERTLQVIVRDALGAEVGSPRSVPISPGEPSRIDLAPPGPGVYEVEARAAGIRATTSILVGSPEPPSAGSPVGCLLAPSTRGLPSAAALVRMGGFPTARIAVGGGTAPGDIRTLIASLGSLPSVALVARGALRPELREFVDLVEVGAGTPPPRLIPAAETGPLVRSVIEECFSAPPGTRLAVPIEEPLVDGEGWPRPPLLALGNANRLLSGFRPRRDLGSLLKPPLRAAAFEKEGRTLLAIWSEAGEADVDLAADAEIIPLLAPPRRLRSLRAGPIPFFVRDADLLNRLSFQLRDPADPAAAAAELPLGTDPVARTLRMRNPLGDSGIAGIRLRIADPLPPGWEVRPREWLAGRLDPGGEFEAGVSFTLPASEEEGPRDLRVEASFVREGRMELVRRTLPLRVVPGIGVSAEISDGPPGEKRVSIRISNPALRPMNLVATVRLPNLPEQSVPLGTVQAGRTAEPLDFRVRELRLVDPARRRVEVIVEERGGGRLEVRRLFPLPLPPR